MTVIAVPAPVVSAPIRVVSLYYLTLQVGVLLPAVKAPGITAIISEKKVVPLELTP